MLKRLVTRLGPLLCLCLCLCLLLGACGAAPAVNVFAITPTRTSTSTPVPTSTPQAYNFSNVVAALGAPVASGTTSGASLIVVRGNAVLLEAARGSFTTDTVVPIASATKVPSALAILTLVDTGRLVLDQPVASYLSFWPSDKSRVSLRELLSHTAGLQTGPSCIFDAGETLDACARTIADLPLESVPGSAFSYGEEDYQVAGRIAEVVTGMKWEDFFNEAIGIPCGLHAFSYGNTDNPRIGGSLSTDLRDYGAILSMLLNEGMCGPHRVLSSALVREMQQDETTDLPIVSSPYADGRNYGMGWWIDPGSGGAEISDSGSSGSVAWIDHARNYAAFLMTDSTWSIGQALWNQVKPLLDQDLGQACGACAGASAIRSAAGGSQMAPLTAADLPRLRWSTLHGFTGHQGPNGSLYRVKLRTAIRVPLAALSPTSPPAENFASWKVMDVTPSMVSWILEPATYSE